MSVLRAIAVLLFVSIGWLPSVAFAQGPSSPALKKVVIAAGPQILDVSYPYLMLPLILDYWKADGYDVEVLATGGSLIAMQQLVAGNASFAQVNSTAVIQANAMNNVPARVVIANMVVDWEMIVLEDSPIRSVKELKGKTIGVSNLGTGGMPLLRGFLQDNGLNPDTDVNVIAIGVGAPALDAIRRNRVQAAMYWKGMIVQFENKGSRFRSFRAPEWDTWADYTLATVQSVVDRDPGMVEAIARGAAKATLFAMTSPDCARRLHWARWPSTKPTGADEATLIQWDMNLLNAQLDKVQMAYQAFGGGRLLGSATADSYGRVQDFLFAQKVINKKVPPESMMMSIPGFYEKINRFDRSAVIAQAKACSAK